MRDTRSGVIRQSEGAHEVIEFDRRSGEMDGWGGEGLLRSA